MQIPVDYEVELVAIVKQSVLHRENSSIQLNEKSENTLATRLIKNMISCTWKNPKHTEMVLVAI